jgi:predicted nuclease of predicted toxin-antitoxin system
VKFLVDECTGIWVSRKLVQLGFDSVSVIEFMQDASDEEVIRKAVEENRIIVTNDKYFGRLAGFNKLPGMILLRLRDVSIENKIKIVTFILASHRNAIPGNVIIVSETKIRVRRISKT